MTSKELVSEQEFIDHYGHECKYSYYSYNVNGIVFFSREKTVIKRNEVTSVSWSRSNKDGTFSNKWESGKTDFLKSLGLKNKDLK